MGSYRLTSIDCCVDNLQPCNDGTIPGVDSRSGYAIVSVRSLVHSVYPGETLYLDEAEYEVDKISSSGLVEIFVIAFIETSKRHGRYA